MRIGETARKAKEDEKRHSRVNACSKSIDQVAVYGKSNSDAFFHRLLPPALYFSSTRTPESAFSSPVTFHLFAYSHTTQHEPRIKLERAFALAAVLGPPIIPLDIVEDALRLAGQLAFLLNKYLSCL